MVATGVEIARLRHFHDLAQVHHRYAIRDVLNDREVMCDEYVGEPEITFQVIEKIDDLSLD